jgi:hypothetical protein
MEEYKNNKKEVTFNSHSSDENKPNINTERILIL